MENLFTMALDAMLIADDQGRYLAANPAACDLLGLPQEELIGRTIMDFLAPEAAAEKWEQFLQVGQLRGEITLIRRDGERRQVEFAARANFAPHQHLSILRDITPRYIALQQWEQAEARYQRLNQDLEQRVAERTEALAQAEALVRAQQQRLDGILNSIDGVVWSVHPTTYQVLYINAAVEQIYGHTAADFMADPTLWLRCVHPEDREHIVALLSRMALPSPKVQAQSPPSKKTLEYRVVRPDGEIRWVCDRSHFIYNDDGQPLRIDGVTIDITATKRLEEAFRLNAAHTRAVLDQAVIGVNQANREGQFIRVNPTFCQMLGYSERELLQLRFQDVTHPEDVPNVTAQVEQLYAGESASVQLERRYIRKDGSLVWASVVLSLLRDEMGEVISDLAMVQDISDRKAAEQAFQESEATKQAMLEAIPDLLSRVNRQGISLDIVSGGAVQIFPGSLSHLPRSLYEVLPPHLAERRLHYIHQALDTGKCQQYEQVIEVRGELRHEESRVVPLNADETLVLVRDITQRKHIEAELQQTKELLEQTSTLARVGGWEVDIPSSRVTWTPMTYAIHEMSPGFQPTLDKAVAFYKPGKSRDALTQVLTRCQETGEPWDITLELITATGRSLWVRTIGQGEFAGETCVRLYGSIQDIDEQMRAKITLQALTEQLQQAQRIAQMGNWWWDLSTQEQYWSPELLHLLGLPPDHPPLDLAQFPNYLHPDDRDRWEQHLHRVHTQGTSQELDLRIIRADGMIRHVNVRTYREQCQEQVEAPCDHLRLFGTLMDITDRKQAEAQQAELYQQLQQVNGELHRLATVDGLTQLANRRHFDQILTQEWVRARRDRTPLALLLCDIDYFKPYNDHYGHPAGDHCLQQVAAALREVVGRQGDLVARYGGEEFAVLLPNTDGAGAIQVAQRIQTAIAALNVPHDFSLISAHLTLSLGIACHDHEYQANTPDDLVIWADAALYQAKAQGRNRYCLARILTPEPGRV